MWIPGIKFLSLVLFVSSVSYGQPGNSLAGYQIKTAQGTNISERKQRRLNSKQQILKLKEGVLLVRLQTRQNTIDALRNIGKNRLADQIEAKQRNYNLRIVNGFASEFNFCPAYFFFSDQSLTVLDGDFKNIKFLTSGLVHDSTIKVNQTQFLTAEFGTSEADTFIYHNGSTIAPDSHWSASRIKNYYGRTNFGVHALLIKSENFIQMRKPFPYRARTFGKLFFKRSVKKTIRRIDRKLANYYKSVHI